MIFNFNGLGNEIALLRDRCAERLSSTVVHRTEPLREVSQRSDFIHILGFMVTIVNYDSGLLSLRLTLELALFKIQVQVSSASSNTLSSKKSP